MSGVAPHFIRIKRFKQTIFFHCDVNVDTVLALKERVEKLTGKPAAQQRLLLGRQNLDNHLTLFDCGIEKEDGEVTLLFLTPQQGPNGEEIWEEWEDALNGPPPEAPQAVPAN